MGRLEVPWDVKTFIDPSLARTKKEIVYTSDPQTEIVYASDLQTEIVYTSDPEKEIVYTSDPQIKLISATNGSRDIS